MKQKYIEGVSTTLVATESTNLLSSTGQDPAVAAKGIDVAGYTILGFQLKNTDLANALTTLVIYWSNDPAGLIWPAVADSTIAFPSPGTVAAGAVSALFRAPVRGRRVRIVVTSTAGGSCALYLFANDEQQAQATEINGASVTGTITGSVTVTAATIAALTDGTQQAQVKSGTKGSSTAALVTSSSHDANHQALDVKQLGNPAVNGTDIANARSFPMAVTGTSDTSALLAGAYYFCSTVDAWVKFAATVAAPSTDEQAGSTNATTHLPPGVPIALGLAATGDVAVIRAGSTNGTVFVSGPIENGSYG